MALRFSSGDVSGFKFLLILAVTYGLIAMLVDSIIHMRFIKPLEIDAPLDRFSEARAVEHVRVLAQEIDGRQVSSLARCLIASLFFFFLPFVFGVQIKNLYLGFFCVWFEFASVICTGEIGYYFCFWVELLISNFVRFLIGRAPWFKRSCSVYYSSIGNDKGASWVQF